MEEGGRPVVFTCCAVAGIVIAGGILLLIDFLLNKIGLKDKANRAILTIVLFAILWIAIVFFILYYLFLTILWSMSY